jgi:hypothetical protein
MLLLCLPLQNMEHVGEFNLSMSGEQLPDIMQLGMNCSRHRVASYLIGQLERISLNLPATSYNAVMSELFTFSIKRRLMVTAMTRQHATALRTLTTMPEFLQHVDAATLHALLKQYVEAGSSSTIRELLQAHSLQETAVQQLTSEAVAELLQAAVERDCGSSAELLLIVPAAKRLPAEALLQLLHAAVASAAPLRGDSACIELLCRHPTANLLTSDVLGRLLQAAVAGGKTKCMRQLCDLPGVQQLTAGSIAQLLQTAVEHSDSAASGALVLQVFSWPATQQLSADVVAQLSDAALQLVQVASRAYKLWTGALDGVKFMQKLLNLPAARDMSSSVVISLLTTAIQLEPQDVRAYHRTAQELADIVTKLCCLPVAQEISAEVAEQLLQAGTPRAELEHSPCITALHQLPAAREVVQAREAALPAICGVLTYCIKQLGLKGLACLAASSKQLRKASLAAVHSDTALLLVDTVKVAATTAALVESKSKRWDTYQQKKAVAWLQQAEPTAIKTAATAQLQQQLLRVPGVPLWMAEQLVAAGFHVSFQQLTAAASSMVAGVEVWMQAHVHQGVKADFPIEAIMAIATDWVSWPVPRIMYVACCSSAFVCRRGWNT